MSTTPTGFPDVLAALDTALERTAWDRVVLGGARPAPAKAKESPAMVLPHARLTLFETGRMTHVLSQRGQRLQVDAKPGQAIHFATRAWDVRCWGPPVRFLGLVFRRGYLRIVRVDHPGGPTPRPACVIAYHTRRPLAGAGLQLIAALDALADAGPPAGLQPAAGELVRALVRLARHHVAEDLRGNPEPDRALHTWQEAIEHIEEHLDRELTRDQVAAALGLHPNYLSTLCTRHGGESFQRTVEGMRLARAQALLASDGGLTVAEVARRTGFADAGYFRRVFRRRLGQPPGRWRAR